MAFSLLQASPIGSNIVRAHLSERPRTWSPISEEDVTYPPSWSIAVISAGSPTVEPPVVAVVENAAARPSFSISYPDAWSVDLRTDRMLDQLTTYILVASPVLVSAAGNPMSSSPLDRDSFPGIVSLPGRVQVHPKIIDVGVDFAYDLFGGVLRVGPSGDLETHSGDDALKKRIVRRVISKPAGFYHLLEYGAGMEVKGLSKISALNDLKLQIEAQVLEEREVKKASVVATASPGVVSVRIAVVTRSSQPLTVLVEATGDGSFTVAA